MNAPNPTPSDEYVNSRPEWYEGFPEPRTIPNGWDLSSLQAINLAAAIREPDHKVEDVTV